MTDSSEHERLAAVAARIRASSALGRSTMLQELFDYLLARTLAGETPREIEIATDVFGRAESELLTDASVRVYVHRLRKKLEDHYAGPGAADAERLVLPKGDYRFELATPQEAAAASDAADVPPAVPARTRRPWLFLLAGLLAGAVLAYAGQRLMASDDGLGEVRASPVWAPIIASRKPLTIVPGDYYILGEKDKPDAEPARLVREFSVNSRGQLDALLFNNPELRDRYVDVDLFYLPVSTAYALKTLMPVLAPGLVDRRADPMVPSSKLTAAQLKNGDILYVGLLSGLGLLQEPVFANSRFGMGGSYDEIIDTKSGQVYVADAPGDPNMPRRNFAFVALLPGPSGNRIVIVAGTRDAALLQAADALSNPATLRALAAAGKDGYFEALFAVDGVGDENLKGTLIAAGPRSAEGMWDGMLDPPVDAP